MAISRTTRDECSHHLAGIVGRRLVAPLELVDPVAYLRQHKTAHAVETIFSALTRQRIRRGSFHSIVSLQAAINCYLDERNAQPRPFIWTGFAGSPGILLKRSAHTSATSS